jgi:riboflavin kinase
MDDVLLLLLRRGAALEPFRLTTTELGLALGMTQQNASRRLAVLEKKGMLERRGSKLLLTKKAVSELRKTYAALRAAFDGIGKIGGIITDGVGDGKYYLSLPGYKSSIRAKFDFDPYPGTLNIRLDKDDVWKKAVLFEDAILLPGFTHDGRAFGESLARRCRINNLQAVAVLPKRTHHSEEIIEIIADRNLRKALSKKTGNSVVLTL